MKFIPVYTLDILFIFFILLQASEVNQRPRSYISKILQKENSKIENDKVQLQNFDSISSLDIMLDTINIRCANQGIPVQYQDINGTKQVCICPLDTKGNFCEQTRSFQCTNTLISPTKNCSISNVSKVGGKYPFFDFPCLFYNSNDTVQFNFTMKCNFTESPNYIQQGIPQSGVNFTRLDYNISGLTFGAIQSNFTYYMISDSSLDPNFAQTSPITQNNEFRVINFFKFSDLSQYQYQQLDRDHFLNNKIFSYTSWFGNYSNQFFAGERLYIEVGLNGVNGLDMNWERIYVDFYDRSEPKKPVPWQDILKYTGISIAVAIALSVLLFSLFCYFWTEKKKKDDLKEK